MGMAFVGFVGMWVAMMAAMMLPAVGPLAAWETVQARAAVAGRQVVGTLAFGAGFLLPWAAYGALAFAALSGTEQLVESSPEVARSLGVGILAVAGGYQFTTWKLRALHHCRTPSALEHGAGVVADFRTGALDGAICVGCCWALMTVFIAVGVMNLPWMAGLAALIFAEKVLPRPRLVAGLGGAVLLALAVAAALEPSMLSGLTPAGMATEMAGMDSGGMEMGGM
jgi:predicted metal-binding membrane protein